MSRSRTFKEFFLEQEEKDRQQDQAEQIAAKMKSLLSDANLRAIVKKYKANSIDDLIEKLKKHPEVQKKIAAWQKAKSQTNEAVLDEGIWSVLKTIWDYTLGPVVNWIKNSVWKTFAHIFGGFTTDASFMQKAVYAGMLITMIGVPIFLLTGGAVAAAGAAALYGGGTFIGLMWFGKNVIEPMMKLSGEAAPA